jgi:hypothetical protein
LATATPDPDPAIAGRLLEVTASSRGDGTTLLRMTADGKIPLGSSRFIAVAGEPARIIVTMRALRAPDLPRTFSLDDPLIDRVRLIHDAETRDGELHLVLHLLRADTEVVEMQQVGPHLVLLLAPGHAEEAAR